MAQLLTVEEVASRLRIRPRTVWELLRQGRLTRIRPTGGRLTRLDADEVEAFIVGIREAGSRKGVA